MSIQFECSCGQALAVREEHAGKRVRCTACGNITTVPDRAPARGGAAVRQTSAAVKAGPPAAAPDVIRFACACGQACQARAEHAGRKTRCPACGEVVPIPGGAVTASPPVARAVREEEPAEDHAEDEAPRRRKKRKIKKSFPWLWVGVAAGGVLLAGGTVLLFFLLRGGGTSSDFDLVPRDAQLFATARVPDVLKSNAGKAVYEEIRKAAGRDLKQIEDAAGLTAADLGRVTFVSMDDKMRVAWIIFDATKAVNKDKLVSHVQGAEKTHDGKKYYHSQDLASSFYFVSDKRFVMGTEEGIKRVIGLKSPTSGPLDEALKLASKGDNHVVLAGGYSAENLDEARRGAATAGIKIDNLLSVKSTVLTARFKNTVEVEATLAFPGDDKAKGAEKELTAFKSILTIAPDPTGGLLRKYSEKLTLKQQGDKVVASINVDASDITNAVRQGGGPPRRDRGEKDKRPRDDFPGDRPPRR